MDEKETPPTTSTGNPVDELKSLPSFNATKAQVQAAMTEITSQAQKLIPSITWQTFHEGSAGNCAEPYAHTAGQDYFFPDQVAVRADVSDESWAKIVAVAKDSAAKIGATTVQVMHDEPGNHDVWFSGATGMYIKVGYQGNLVVSGYTGCRLP